MNAARSRSRVNFWNWIRVPVHNGSTFRTSVQYCEYITIHMCVCVCNMYVKFIYYEIKYYYFWMRHIFHVLRLKKMVRFLRSNFTQQFPIVNGAISDFKKSISRSLLLDRPLSSNVSSRIAKLAFSKRTNYIVWLFHLSNNIFHSIANINVKKKKRM